MILSHESARLFWRLHGDGYLDSQRRIVTGKSMTRVLAKDARAVAESFHLPLPLDVMTLEAKEGSLSDSFVKHICTVARSTPCAVLIAPGLYVVCPELCFVQAAQRADIVGSIKLGFEFCGTYMPDPHGVAGQRSRPPLCTPESLRDFIEKLEHKYPGTVEARKALRYVIPGSASTAETALTMLCTLPYRMGGFNLPRPKLNQEVRLGHAGSRVVGRGVLKPDLLWRKEKVALEYNSKSTHGDDGQREYDDRRNNALQDKDFRYFICTTAIL